MFINILIVIVVWILGIRWQRRRKVWCCAQFKNDLNALPLVGHAAILFGNGEDKAKSFQALGREALKQGGITSLHAWIADQFHIVIADPVVAELVLKNHLEKDNSMKMFGKIFPESLPIVTVSKWRPRRKTLNPTFALKHLNPYTDIFRKNCDILIQKLRNVGDEPFSIYDHVVAHNFNVISETTFGVEAHDQIELKKETLAAILRSFNLIANRMTQPLYHNDFAYEMTSQYQRLKESIVVLHHFANKNIKNNYEKMKKYITNDSIKSDQSENKPKTLQQLLIEVSHGEIPEEILVKESLIVLFAGTDTSSVVVSFTCLLLAKYPDIQEKAYQELQDVLDKRSIEAEDLPKLKYIEAVLKESMRLYPPGLLLLRNLDNDLVLPSGQVLVKGMGAMINVWAIHRNPRYWGADAEMFRPERFLDSSLAHPAAYLPFSCGPRNCVGFQYAMISMKTTLATLLQHFRVLPAKNNHDIDNKHQDIRTTFDILTRDADNFALRIEARTQ